MIEENPTQRELVENLRADQRRQWLRGERVALETYFQEHPQLLEESSDALELLYSEVMLREETGEAPSLDEYARRFPRLASQLGPLFEVHKAIESGQMLDATGDFETPADTTLPRSDSEAASPWPIVRGYQILGELGRGGMGVVYKARHVRLNRVVALKMILTGSHANLPQMARFRAEAEAVARLQHPNIVQIHDVAEQDGRPYFSLEFVDGGSLAQKLNGTPQSARPAATLIETLARAIHTAHQVGIVHRDLKPANILLQLADSRVQNADLHPTNASAFNSASFNLQSAIPKITDFGLAKQIDVEGGQTLSGNIVGTPCYMAPEQATGRRQEIGPATDVYALGVILYELLAGHPPFKAESQLDTLRLVVSADPVSFSRLYLKVPYDLGTICLKCLHKDPRKRYASALSLAEDLRRFLNDQPIQARRTSISERTWRWCRRNPILAGLTAAVATLLVVVAVSATVAALQFRLVAEEKEGSLYVQRIALAHREILADNLGGATGLLDACPVDRQQWEWHYLKRLCLVEPTILQARAHQIHCAAFSPDGRRIAAGNGDGTIALFNVETGEQVQTLRGHKGHVLSLAFHSDGKRLASAGADRTVKVWELTTGLETFCRAGHEGVFAGGATVVAFSPDGRCLASGSADKSTIMISDATSGQELFSLPGHEALATSVAFSPDNQRLASTSFGGILRIWDAQTHHLLHTIKGHAGPIGAVTFRPDGRCLATSGYDRLVKIWDATTGKLQRVLEGHTGLVLGLAYSRDGRRLASGGEDKAVKLWDADTGQELLNLHGHTALCQCVTFSPDGRRFASASMDGTIRIWDGTPLTGSEGLASLTLKHGAEVWSVAFSPDDNQRIASGSWDNTVKLWDPTTGTLLRTLDLPGHVFSLAFSPDNKYLAATSAQPERHSVLKLWNQATGQEIHSIPDDCAPYCVNFSPDSRYLLREGVGHTVRVLDAQTGREMGTLGQHAAAGSTDGIWCLRISPDGRRLVSASYNRPAKVWQWDVTRLGQSQVPLEIAERVWGFADMAAFTPDGSRLVIGGKEHTVKVWDANTGQEIQSLAGHTGHVLCVAVSPDGRWIASAGEDTTVRLWDATAGKLLHTLRGHTGLVSSVAFSPDGRRLVSGSRDHTVKVWDLSRLDKRLK